MSAESEAGGIYVVWEYYFQNTFLRNLSKNKNVQNLIVNGFIFNHFVLKEIVRISQSKEGENLHNDWCLDNEENLIKDEKIHKNKYCVYNFF